MLRVAGWHPPCPSLRAAAVARALRRRRPHRRKKLCRGCGNLCFYQSAARAQDLAKSTGQPLSALRVALADIADLQRKGPAAGAFTLKAHLRV